MSESDKLVESRYLLNQYSIDPSFSGFDLIVISSRDESQKLAFDKQIQHMIACDEHYMCLNANVMILVISDEQFTLEAIGDIKLGAGGSTIHIFKWIASQFGANIFFEKKILLMHSGGYSQRLPHYSILGKLFANLPILTENGTKLWTLLDLKFAFLAPFASKMKNGVYVTASDDIVVYSFNSDEFNALPQFSEDIFVALGHPSSVDIAVNHGVYILPDNEINNITSRTVFLKNCVKVLQKPTLEQLISQNGILKNDNNCSFSITDSSYYIGANIIVEKFLSIDVKSLESEIDCYGDFLCPLGSSPITKDRVNPYYSPFADLLARIPLKVLYLPHSKFYHLGTLTEYMDALTNYSEKQLAIDLCFKSPNKTDSIKGTILCSLINQKSIIDANSVVEYCDFSNAIIETDNNLLYNCVIYKSDNQVIKFPPNYLIYSVPVILDKLKGWCTFCCRLDSKLKSKIYTDKIFPVFETSAESLIATINIAQQSMRSDLYEKSIKLSMREVNDVKDIDTIIEMHQHLKSFRHS